MRMFGALAVLGLVLVALTFGSSRLRLRLRLDVDVDGVTAHASAALAVGDPPVATASSEPQTHSGEQSAIQDREGPAPYIVALHRRAGARGLAAVAALVRAAADRRGVDGGAAIRHTYRRAFLGFSARMAPEDAASLRSHALVRLVAPDAAVSPAQAVDFTALGYGPQPWGDVAPWHLDRLDQASGPLDGRFDRGTVDGAGVDIYVVDTGVLATHPELEGRVVPLYDVDSALYAPGSELLGSDCSPESHGTAVAAAAAGRTLGAAPGSTVLSVKVFARSGGAAGNCSARARHEDVLAGLEDVLASVQNRGRPSVTLLAVSLTWSNADSSLPKAEVVALYTTAVARLREARSVVITAAGNDYADACNSMPGNTPGAINVGASDQDDYRAGFSNYGSCVTLFAPGQNVRSALRPAAVAGANGLPGFNATTGIFHGTSYAAGIAAGVAALYLQALLGSPLSAIEDAMVGGSIAAMRASILGQGSPKRLLSVSKVLLPGATGAVGPAAYDASLFSGVEIGMCSFTPNTTAGRPSTLHRQLLQWGDAYFDAASEPAKASGVFLARLRIEQDYNGLEITLRNFELTYPSLAVYIGNPTMPSYERRLYGWFWTENVYGNPIVERYGASIRPGTYYVLVQGNSVYGNVAGPGLTSYRWGGFGNASGAFRLDVFDTVACPYHDYAPDHWTDDGTCKFTPLGTCSQDLVVARARSVQNLQWLAEKAAVGYYAYVPAFTDHVQRFELPFSLNSGEVRLDNNGNRFLPRRSDCYGPFADFSGDLYGGSVHRGHWCVWSYEFMIVTDGCPTDPASNILARKMWMYDSFWPNSEGIGLGFRISTDTRVLLSGTYYIAYFRERTWSNTNTWAIATWINEYGLTYVDFPRKSESCKSDGSQPPPLYSHCSANTSASPLSFCRMRSSTLLGRTPVAGGSGKPGALFLLRNLARATKQANISVCTPQPDVPLDNINLYFYIGCPGAAGSLFIASVSGSCSLLVTDKKYYTLMPNHPYYVIVEAALGTSPTSGSFTLSVSDTRCAGPFEYEPAGPLEAGVVSVNATRVVVLVSFTPGENVTSAQVECSGATGLFAVNATATDDDAKGLEVGIDLAPSFSGSFDLSCRALVRASTGVESAWTSGTVVKVPAAAPWAPLEVAASVTNATQAVVRVSYTSKQSVTSVTAECLSSSDGVTYKKDATVTDAAAAGIDFSFALPPLYSGSFELSCRALVRASTGLPSLWTSAAVVTVPAATPSAPLETAVVFWNATLGVARVTFTPGQSASAVEMQCLGAGGPYAVNATVTGAAASGVNISVGLVPSYSGSFALSCRALVRASTGLPSPWTSAAVVTVPAAVPWAPLSTSVSAPNATQAVIRVSYMPDQNVTTVEVYCSSSGSGGPYAVNASTTDAAASGVNITVGLVPSYSGNVEMSCATRVHALSGLPSSWTSATVATVPAAVPWAPLETAVVFWNATQAVVRVSFTPGQSASAVEMQCLGAGGPYAVNATVTDAAASGVNISVGLVPSYSGSFALSCKALVRASTGLSSTLTSAAMVTVPAAAPWAPLSNFASATNATQADIRVAYMPDQNVTSVEVFCSSSVIGGPYAVNASTTDAAALGVNVSIGLVPSYIGSFELSCRALVRASTGLPSPWTSAAVVTVPAAVPWAPLSNLGSATNATQAVICVSYVPGQNVSAVEVYCSSSGSGGPYAVNASTTDAAALGINITVGLVPSYSGSFELSCATRVHALSGLPSSWTSAAMVTVPAAAPWAPLETAVVFWNATQAAMRVSFTPGQSVSAVEMQCLGAGGPYAVNATAAGAAASGVIMNISVGLVPSYSSSFALSCRALVRASTGLPSPWTSAAVVTVPAAVPWAPLSTSVSAPNATQAVIRVSYMPDQNVTTVEVYCSSSGSGGPYAVNASTTDAAASGVNITVGLVPSYSGNVEMSCATRVHALSGLPSSWTSATVATVPAAVPWAPLETAVVFWNATQAVVRVSFTPGQSVSAVEMQCLGAGGPYAVNATVTDAAASGVNISVGLVPSYSGSFALSCKALVRASTGLSSTLTSAAMVTVPAAAPWAPLSNFASATNATQAVIRVAYMPDQNVTSVEVFCSSSVIGGPYAVNASTTDAAASGVNVSIGLVPSYIGSFELSCRALVRASTGLPSPWTSAAVVTVPAAVPWAPLSNLGSATNATQAVIRVPYVPDQNVTAVEVYCSGVGDPYAVNASTTDAAASGINITVGLVPSYSGSFELSCATRVHALSGLPSSWTSAAMVTVPAAVPWAPLETAVVFWNATQAVVRVSFTPGQSVSAVEMQCLGAGGPYAVNATVTGAAASGLNISVGLMPSYSGSFELSCRALVRASTGLSSPWTAAAVVTVPAAAPDMPALLSAVALNSSLAEFRLSFRAGQNVTSLNVSCSGVGGPYRALPAVADTDSSGAVVLMPVSPSYLGNYTLDCALSAVGVTGLPSTPGVRASLPVLAANPWTPSDIVLTAINATCFQADAAFSSEQGVAYLEHSCNESGRAFTYVGSVPVGALQRAAGRLSFLVATRPQYSGSYSVDCAFSVRATTGLLSPPARAATSIPAAAPGAPAIASLAAANASALALEVGFAAGQSVELADVRCTGAGGPYAANFTAASPPLRALLPVSVSEAGSWPASCTARLLSSAGVASAWSPPAPATVPGVFLMKRGDVSLSSALVAPGAAFSAVVAFRSSLGFAKVALLGRRPASAAAAAGGAILVHDVERGTWAEATARAPFEGYGVQCAWDNAAAVFCTGGYVGTTDEASAAAWALSSSLDERVDLPAMPAPRANHCMTVFNRTLWVFGGEGSNGAARNDLISYDVSGRVWATDANIRQGNVDLPRRPNPSCARIDGTWYVAVVSEDGDATIEIHAIELGWSAAGGRAARLAGAVARSSPSAFRLGACQGYLFAVLADANATLLFLDPKDASAEHVAGLGVALASPALVADCSSCTAMLFGVANETGPAQQSRLLSLAGTVPLAAAACGYPSDGELPAVPFQLLPPPQQPTPLPTPPPRRRPDPLALAAHCTPGRLPRAHADALGAAPAAAAPTPPAPSATPAAGAGSVEVEFWLTVPATRGECEAYVQGRSLASVSQGFSRFLATALRVELDEGRVQIAGVRCGSILFHVQVLKAVLASKSVAVELPAAFILEAMANLTRAGELLMPGLDDRPVAAMGNATFAPGLQPEGPAAEALARGETILAPEQPVALVDQPPPTPTFPATAPAAAPSAPGGGGGGSPMGAAIGAAAAAGALVVAIGVGFGVYWKRRQRARAFGAGSPTDTAEMPFISLHSSASLLQAITGLTPHTDGSLPSVWLDLPALTGDELDLLGAARPAEAAGGSSAVLGEEANDLTLAQRATLAPPRPVPEPLLRSVREPLAMLGEGAFGRVYAIALPEWAATWLRDGDAAEGAGGAEGADGGGEIKRAVKEVSLSDPQVAAREIHGARLQKVCDHPNVLRCEALFTDRFKIYIVMPLAEMSLSALLASRGLLPADLLASFALQIAAGMAYLHHELPRPVAHRDLKPQNILVFRKDDGKGPTLRVGDFGISRHVETAKSLRGTLVYLPPETYSKNDPVKADVWAFGIILMEMATGRRPYGGAAIGPEHLIRGQPFPRSSFAAVPEPLRPLARACLSKNSSQRPTFLAIRQTLAEMLPQPPAAVTIELDVEGPAFSPAPGAPALTAGAGGGAGEGAHVDHEAVTVSVLAPDPWLPPASPRR
eukprot:tig00001413_g8635.t1